MQLPHEYQQFLMGPMQCFTYFIGSKNSDEVFVVDPGWDGKEICKKAENQKKYIRGILCTHSHKDHVDAINTILEKHDVPVFMSKEEIEYFNFQNKNLKPLNHGEKIFIADLAINVLITPGHTIGSTCYKFGPYLLTGDTLFINACGRCDLQSSSPEQMYISLRKIVDELPENTVILPGHDYGPTPTDTLKGQMQTNPYLNHKSLDSFIEYRMKPRM